MRRPASLQTPRLRFDSAKLQNGTMIDWNDLRHFLAVAKAGTTLAAARELGVSQSTVARRIDALETVLGLKLFDRRQSGYALTDIGKELAETATEVEVAAGAFASRAAALRRSLTGTVRITTNDLFAGEVLTPSLNVFRQAHPRDRAGDGDLRPPPRPRQGRSGRRVARRHAAVASAPRRPAYRQGHLELLLQSGLPSATAHRPRPATSPTTRCWAPTRKPSLAPWWTGCRDQSRDTRSFSSRTASPLLASLRNGLGVGLMADFVARSDPQLMLCFEPDIDVDYEIWLLTHERLRNDPHVRAVLDFLDRHLRSERRGPGAIDRPRRAASAPKPRRK